MIKSLIIFILVVSNLWVGFLLFDFSVTVDHLESASKGVMRRNGDLLKDISDIYLCSSISKDIIDNGGVVYLHGATIYVVDGVAVGVGLKGEPEPRFICVE